MRFKNLKILALFAIIQVNIGCRKDKVPLPKPPPELTKYEKIAGNYYVYDTIGNFLYEMNLSHSVNYISSYSIIDTIHFVGFEDQFYFNTSQGIMANPITYDILIGPNVPVLDSLDNRWRIYTHYDPSGVYDNTYRNDTIRMIYRKTNILYWLQDLTPYKDTVIKIVAIKQ